MAKEEVQAFDTDQQVDTQAREQTGQAVRLRIDSREMSTSYANAFRANGSAEEVVLEFGLNQMTKAPQSASGNNQAQEGEILFQLSDRVIMNYYTAKRLAITLGQLVSRHEQQFGELKLNVSDRVQKSGR